MDPEYGGDLLEGHAKITGAGHPHDVIAVDRGMGLATSTSFQARLAGSQIR